MEQPEFLPIYHRPGTYEDGIWTFQTDNSEVSVANLGEEIGSILKIADGHTSSIEIEKRLAESGLDSVLVSRIIGDLRKLQVLVDSREQFSTFHDLTTNPSSYSMGLTAREIVKLSSEEAYVPRKGEAINPNIMETTIGALLKKRESCRNFEIDPLTSSIIATCLDAAYSSERRPVPSAGGLYPLRLYALIKNGDDMSPGYYQYNHEGQELIKLKGDVDWDRLHYIFNSEDLVHNAPVIFVIVADLSVHPAKYANRGYRYTLLEAGHAAQNIHLVAGELGLSSLEYGGFNDEKLAYELDLSTSEKPLVTLAIGKRAENPTSPNFFETLIILENYVGPDKPIEWVRINALSEAGRALDFYHATAKYRPPSSIYPEDSMLYGSGTANSIDLARVKAIAEAYERYVAGKFTYDVLKPASELQEDWLSPISIKPLTDEQYNKQQENLDKFDMDKPIHWIYGQKYEGTPILVPADLVFYPLNEALTGRKNVAESNSSGMAAHTDYDEAVKRGLLELIERDATMRLWFDKQAPNRIATESLPKHFKDRNEYWERLGKRVEVLDSSHDGIAIANVIIRSPDGSYPFMVSGTAASDESFELAMSKAYQESELGFANAMFAEKKQDWVEPQNVHSPEDHGRFYYYDYSKTEIEWLWSGRETRQIPIITSDPKILEKYQPIVVRLTKGEEPLQVVRVLCPQLVPINFGFGNEYYSHPAVGMSKFVSNVPHFFA